MITMAEESWTVVDSTPLGTLLTEWNVHPQMSEKKPFVHYNR